MSEISYKELMASTIHFVGIGGGGMSGIARILLALGADVSGSDVKDSSVLDGLRTLGARIEIGHSEAHVPQRGVLVVSSAIAEGNPELIAARARGLVVLLRAQALAIIMSQKRAIAIAGTHGKTTTTSMATVALQRCGADPSFAIGAAVTNSGTNAHHGSGDIFVAEADESDGSFLAYQPFGAVITNIELDHVDNFHSLAEMDELFAQFIDSIQSGGFLVACIDDSGVNRALSKIQRTDLSVITYGESSSADLKIDRISLTQTGSISRVTWKGRVLGELNLKVPGRHNVANAAATLATALHLGFPIDQLFAGLQSFTGARRRFEIKGEVNGVTVVDDYGHHPTEIRVTLEAARNFAGNGRILVIFQPHRFSRTEKFAAEFAHELSQADHVFLLEIYAASEKPIPGTTSLSISKLMKSEKVTYEPSMPVVIEQVVKMAERGDLIMTLGAGDVSALGPLIVDLLHQ
mgnify:FL=1